MKLSKTSYFGRFYRYCYLKLIIPTKREKQNAKYIARATGIGIFCGLTPIFWQMNIVLIIWVVAKYFKFSFSLPIALAWTWISNGATNLILFYIYYKLGLFLLGRSGTSFDSFMALFNNGFFHNIKSMFYEYVEPIIAGSFTLMIIFSVLGYITAYILVEKGKKRKLLKNKKTKHLL